MRRTALVAILLLAACGGDPFAGVEPVRLRVNGFDLDVYRSGDRFQVLLATREYRSERAFVHTATAVTERVTGCSVRLRTMSGGPARLSGRLDC